MGVVANLKFKKAPEGFVDPAELADKISEAYLSMRKQSSFKTKKSFSPSTLGYGYGNCPRYWFIAFTGAQFEDSTSDQAIASMENGIKFHDRLQEVFGKTGHVKYIEQEIRNDYPPIFGFIDAGLEGFEPVPDEEIVVELKSIKQEKYDIRKAEMKPEPNHLIQVLTYMKLRKARMGFIIYENKNDQELLIIPIYINDRYIKIMNDLFEWMENTYDAFTNGTLPERPKGFTKSKPSCKYCPVRKTCFEELEKGVVALPAFENPK